MHEPPFDPTAKYWRCSCGDCRRVAERQRLLLIVLLWDLDRLFSFAR